MKTFFKTALFLMFSLTLGMNTALAQQNNPKFTIKWDGCDLGTTQYKHFVTYTIYDVINSSIAYGPFSSTISYPDYNWPVEIDNWDCDQSSELNRFILIIHVDYLNENDEIVCSGNLRTNAFPCGELYNENIYTVTLN